MATDSPALLAAVEAASPADGPYGSMGSTSGYGTLTVVAAIVAGTGAPADCAGGRSLTARKRLSLCDRAGLAPKPV
jgi:hypothetical protein